MNAPLKPTRDLRFAWVTAGLLLAVALLALLVLRPLAATGADPLVGAKAPDFALPVIHGGDPGNRIRLSDLRGRVVVLDFFASWCLPCQEAAAVLGRTAAQHGGDELLVVGIATADTADEAARFAASHAPGTIAVHDADGAVARSFGAADLPTLVVIDPAGIVVEVARGVVTDEALEEWITKALSHREAAR